MHVDVKIVKMNVIKQRKQKEIDAIIKHTEIKTLSILLSFSSVIR